MRKTLLFVAFALLVATLQAQPVLTQSAVGTVGSTFYIGIQDTFAPGAGVGSAGINQTWVLDTLQVNGLDTVWFTPPSDSPDASNFPSSNLAIRQASIANGYAFLQSSAAGLDLLGIAGDVLNTGTPIVLHQNPPLRVASFPFTYLDAFTNTTVIDTTMDASGFGIPFVDSARYKNTQIRDLQADAYGTLALPAQTYSNVLRVKEINDQHTQIFVHTFLGWSTYQDTTFTDSTFTWWNDTKGYYLAQAAYQGPRLNTIRYEDPVIVSRPEPRENAFQVYPNPADNRLFINTDGKVYEIRITDLQGRLISQQKLIGAHAELNVSDLPRGFFLYSLLDKNGLTKQSGKLLLSR